MGGTGSTQFLYDPDALRPTSSHNTSSEYILVCVDLLLGLCVQKSQVFAYFIHFKLVLEYRQTPFRSFNRTLGGFAFAGSITDLPSLLFLGILWFLANVEYTQLALICSQSPPGECIDSVSSQPDNAISHCAFGKRANPCVYSTSLVQPLRYTSCRTIWRWFPSRSQLSGPGSGRRDRKSVV